MNSSWFNPENFTPLPLSISQNFTHLLLSISQNFTPLLLSISQSGNTKCLQKLVSQFVTTSGNNSSQSVVKTPFFLEKCWCQRLQDPILCHGHYSLDPYVCSKNWTKLSWLSPWFILYFEDIHLVLAGSFGKSQIQICQVIVQPNSILQISYVIEVSSD